MISLFGRFENTVGNAEMMISLFDRLENAVGKGENSGHQYFLLFPQCFLLMPL